MSNDLSAGDELLQAGVAGRATQGKQLVMLLSVMHVL